MCESNRLLASTALVATAGIAAADIKISGYAEMGVIGGSDTDTQFHTDIDATFSMTGESDGGLSFGASVDLDEGGSGAAAHANDADDGGATMFIAYSGLKLTMGDVDGALDAAVPEMALAGGAIADDQTAHAGYNSHGGIGGTGKVYLAARAAADNAEAVADAFINGAPNVNASDVYDALNTAFTAIGALGVDVDGIARVAAKGKAYEDDDLIDVLLGLDGDDLLDGVGDKVDQLAGALATFAALKGHDAIGDGQIAQLSYSIDALTLYASAEQVANGADVAGAGDTTFGIGAKYSMDMGTSTLTAGIGYQTTADVADTTAVGLSFAMENGLSAGISYTVADVEGADENGSHLGLGVGYTMNALSLGLNYGVYEYDGIEKDGFGIAATYDLGGGLAAHAGFGSSNYDSDLENFAGMSDNDTYSFGLSMSF